MNLQEIIKKRFFCVCICEGVFGVYKVKYLQFINKDYLQM